MSNWRAHLAGIHTDVSGTSVYPGSAQISDLHHGLRRNALNSYPILLNQKPQREGMHCWKPTSDCSQDLQQLREKEKTKP